MRLPWRRRREPDVNAVLEFVWYEAVREVVPNDLSPGFEDGDDIVLRWPGNKAEWGRVRALIADYERRHPAAKERQ